MMVGNVTDIIMDVFDTTSVTALPNGLINIEIGNSPLLTSLPAFPNTLVIADFANNELSSLPTLPSSLQSINLENNNLTTAILDQAATEFLTGTLPKQSWSSFGQTTTDQPSPSVQANLTANVNFVSF